MMAELTKNMKTFKMYFNKYDNDYQAIRIAWYIHYISETYPGIWKCYLNDKRAYKKFVDHLMAEDPEGFDNLPEDMQNELRNKL